MESDTLALLRPHVDADDVVVIEVDGSTPLGVFMDNDIPTRAVIKEFKKVGDSIGPIQKHPDMHEGAVLVAINGKDVSGLSLKEVGEILKSLKDKAKVLGWRVERQLKSVDLGPPPTSENATTPNVPDPVQSVSGTPSDSVAIDIGRQTSLASSSSLNLDNSELVNTVSIRCPPGPLGLLLNAESPDRAVVIGFQPLPDGSKGVPELSGTIRRGALLVRVNGEDVSSWSLDAVKTRLGELADQERDLEFLPPRGRAQSQDYSRRRKEEFTFMKLNDSTKIERGECWLVINAKWVERWVAFAALNGPPPGPVDNEVLVQEGWEDRMEGKIPGDPDMPRENLKLSEDYRCVTPLVWCFFVALHGTSKMPPIARFVYDLLRLLNILSRYSMNIHSRQLPALELNRMLKGPALKAEITVKEIKNRCQLGSN
ncbi:unnamed protein product [Aphanomyces euteiches]